MRDPNRIDKFIEQLRAIWKSNPHLRFGQLNLNMMPTPPELDNWYQMEDDEYMIRLKSLYYNGKQPV